MTFQIFVGGQRVNSDHITSTPAWADAQVRSDPSPTCGANESLAFFTRRPRPLFSRGRRSVGAVADALPPFASIARRVNRGNATRSRETRSTTSSRARTRTRASARSSRLRAASKAI
eukprot:31197-Pelagococcus_subviridis.AAC.49